MSDTLFHDRFPPSPIHPPPNIWDVVQACLCHVFDDRFHVVTMETSNRGKGGGAVNRLGTCGRRLPIYGN